MRLDRYRPYDSQPMQFKTTEVHAAGRSVGRSVLRPQLSAQRKTVADEVDDDDDNAVTLTNVQVTHR